MKKGNHFEMILACSTLLMSVGIVSYFYFDPKPRSLVAQPKAEIEAAQHQRKLSEEMTALGARHDALIDWEKLLPYRGEDELYTIDVSRALVRPNQQPVFFVMRLQDIAETERGLIARFSQESFRGNTGPLDLFLTCSPAQVDVLLRLPRHSRFAIVARVIQVYRLGFSQKIEDSGEDASIEIDEATPSSRFYGKGELLDFLPTHDQ